MDSDKYSKVNFMICSITLTDLINNVYNTIFQIKHDINILFHQKVFKKGVLIFINFLISYKYNKKLIQLCFVKKSQKKI